MSTCPCSAFSEGVHCIGSALAASKRSGEAKNFCPGWGVDHGAEVAELSHFSTLRLVLNRTLTLHMPIYIRMLALPSLFSSILYQFIHHSTAKLTLRSVRDTS